MDGWNTIVSFWDGLFSGAMLVSGSVFLRGGGVALGGKKIHDVNLICLLDCFKFLRFLGGRYVG